MVQMHMMIVNYGCGTCRSKPCANSFAPMFFFLHVGYWSVYCVSDSCSFKKQLACRPDYGFHGYMEVCQFVYCLLSRSRKLGSLPSLDACEEYMDPSKLKAYENVAAADFLCNHEFGAVLRRHKSGESQVFRGLCGKFMDRLVTVILSQQSVTGDLPQGIYSFCPELLLEGDDHHMLLLFRKLIRVLERSGVKSALESKSATEEYSTFVVDARARHVSSEGIAEAIQDVRHHLLSDYSFLARKSLCRVFKLCCLVVSKPRMTFPAVDLDRSGCAVPELVVTTCIQGVQSCVVSSEFKLGSFFTKFTIGQVRKSIVSASSFMLCSDFDPWDGLCSGGQSAFVGRYRRLFNDRISRKRSNSCESPCDVGDPGHSVESGGEGGCFSQSESPAASSVSAPPCSSSGGSSSFRPSKTKVYGSIASLLGRKKSVEGTGEHASKKSKKKSGQSSSKGIAGGSERK